MKGLTLVSAMCAGGTVLADDIVVTDGLWKVTYMESEKAFRINVLDEGGAARKCVVNHSASAAHYDNAGGTPREVTTASFATVEQSVAEVDDAFGAGRCYTFTFTGPDNGDEVAMRQRFYIYPGRDYLLTDLSLVGDAGIRSNYLAPVSVDGGSYVLFCGIINDSVPMRSLLVTECSNDI